MSRILQQPIVPNSQYRPYQHNRYRNPYLIPQGPNTTITDEQRLPGSYLPPNVSMTQSFVQGSPIVGRISRPHLGMGSLRSSVSVTKGPRGTSIPMVPGFPMSPAHLRASMTKKPRRKPTRVNPTVSNPQLPVLFSQDESSSMFNSGTTQSTLNSSAPMTVNSSTPGTQSQVSRVSRYQGTMGTKRILDSITEEQSLTESISDAKSSDSLQQESKSRSIPPEDPLPEELHPASPLPSEKPTEALIARLKSQYSHEPEFLEAAQEVLESLGPALDNRPDFLRVLKAMVEPERILSFRVIWMDDSGEEQVNRGWRVQFSSVLGPYKGGMRFHPSVNQSILKFLGFEQIFKNALTGLPLGGGKGGSDFDPKGKSDEEIRRFCQALMSELHRHIGPDVDVPAGDIGVGAREVNFMFGAFKKLKNAYQPGVLTGKHLLFGGSNLRPEATGFGVAYFLQEIYIQLLDKPLAGQRVMVTGSGNVALFCIEKLLDMGAIPITCSDSNGTRYYESGITRSQLIEIKHHKEVLRGRLSTLESGVFLPSSLTHPSAASLLGDSIRSCDVVLPCATQNEITPHEAQKIVDLGVKAVVEGANMPTTKAAVQILMDHQVAYGPAKAANAGGVSVSGLEMAQNASMAKRSRAEVDADLQKIMKDIFEDCSKSGATWFNDPNNLKDGANIAAFTKVATAMIAQGTY